VRARVLNGGPSNPDIETNWQRPVSQLNRVVAFHSGNGSDGAGGCLQGCTSSWRRPSRCPDGISLDGEVRSAVGKDSSIILSIPREHFVGVLGKDQHIEQTEWWRLTAATARKMQVAACKAIRVLGYDRQVVRMEWRRPAAASSWMVRFGSLRDSCIILSCFETTL
jgi:hypothetical protein